MPPRIMTDVQLSWAHEQNRKGYTYEEIAEALYINVSTVMKEFKASKFKKVCPELKYSEHDVPLYSPVVVRPDRRCMMTNHQINWAYSHYCQGYTLKYLAVVLDVPLPTMQNSIKRHYLKRYHPILIYPDYETEGGNNHEKAAYSVSGVPERNIRRIRK